MVPIAEQYYVLNIFTMNLETFVDAYGVIRDAQSKNTTP
jgi:hypothetical protein